MSETREDLLVERTDLADVVERGTRLQRKRLLTGLASVLVGIVGIALGLWLGGDFLAYGITCLLAPAFGVGFFLMGGMEVRRLQRELDEVDERLRLAGHGEAWFIGEAAEARGVLSVEAAEVRVDREESDS